MILYCAENVIQDIPLCFYRVSINSFPDYKHLLKENYVQYKYIFFKCNSRGFLETKLSNGKKCFCIPRGFLVINVCNQETTLCSPCVIINNHRNTVNKRIDYYVA